MFENRNDPVLPFKQFIIRLLFIYGLGLLVLVLALIIGIIGFYYFESMDLLDAFENSAMILSTMGPVIHVASAGGKMFAAFYALFSGLIFVSLMGVLFAPFIHRMIHKFHCNHHQH